MPMSPDRKPKIFGQKRSRVVAPAITAWVETLHEPSPARAAQIDQMMDEVLAEELGRPLKGLQRLAEDSAARLARIDSMVIRKVLYSNLSTTSST